MAHWKEKQMNIGCQFRIRLRQTHEKVEEAFCLTHNVDLWESPEKVGPHQMVEPHVRWKSHGVTAAMRSPGRNLLNLSMAYHVYGNSKEKMALAPTWRGGTGIGTTTSLWSSQLTVGSSAPGIHLRDPVSDWGIPQSDV